MNKNKTAILLILILCGLVLGGIVGEIFKSTVPMLSYGKSIGFDTVNINLGIIKIVLGLDISINLASILGILIAFIVYGRLKV
jgi:hypothetical protein